MPPHSTALSTGSRSAQLHKHIYPRRVGWLNLTGRLCRNNIPPSPIRSFVLEFRSRVLDLNCLATRTWRLISIRIENRHSFPSKRNPIGRPIHPHRTIPASDFRAILPCAQ
ncbi:hypothetical protein V2G26_020564 [Clonostachys chloroleuca]